MSHVALLIPGLDRIGGAERQVLLLATGLRRRGWRVSVVALSGRGTTAANQLAASKIDFFSLGMRKGLADPRGWVAFHLWLRRERPDIIHAHLPHAAWLARWSCAALPAQNRPALIDTLHSSAVGGIGRRLGYRISRSLSGHVTAVSRAVADAHTAARMVFREKLAVIPNGIDVEVFRPDPRARTEVRRELGLGDEFVWIAVGRLEAVKDYPTLLQAMAGVPGAAQLLIAGAGPLEAELQALAARLGLVNCVRFLGFQSHLERLMQAADGFVLASLWEGLPMTLLEAAACGVPAVATGVSGTREAVAEEESAHLVPPRDSPALAAAMQRLMQLSAQERGAMGARARKRVVEQFSIEAVLDRWEDLYRETGV